MLKTALLTALVSSAPAPEMQIVNTFPEHTGNVQIFSIRPTDIDYHVVGYYSECSDAATFDQLVDTYAEHGKKYGANGLIITRSGPPDTVGPRQGSAARRSRFCMDATAIRVGTTKPLARSKEEVYFDIGIGFYKNKELDKAIQYLTRVIDAEPWRSHAWFARGLSHIGKGDTAQAMEDIKISATLEYTPAIEFLRARKIEWKR